MSLLTSMVKLIPAASYHAVGMVLQAPLDPQKLSRPQLAKLLGMELQELADCEWQKVHEGTTTRWRLVLPAQQTTLFAKTNPPDFSTRFFGAMFQLGLNELGFYRDIQPHLSILTPSGHGLTGNRYRYLIMIDDLGDKAEFTDLKSRCDLERAQSVVDTLAELHASCWQDPRFEKQWQWVNRQQYRRNHAFLNMLRDQSSVTAIKRYREFLPDVTPALAKALNQAYPRLEQLWGEEPRTLIHGDAHIGNMFFLPDGKTGLLDWQVLGYEQGMRDITYFIINSLPTEVRLQHQDELIERYVKNLNDAGIDFSIDTARKQYLQHASYVWISAAVTAASNTMQEKKIAAAGLIRASKAMEDLNVLSVLEAL